MGFERNTDVARPDNHSPEWVGGKWVVFPCHACRGLSRSYNVAGCCLLYTPIPKNRKSKKSVALLAVHAVMQSVHNNTTTTTLFCDRKINLFDTLLTRKFENDNIFCTVASSLLYCSVIYKNTVANQKYIITA